MTEGTGWPGKVKLALYARLEELSFRSAVATATGVLAITGLSVSLTVTASGGRQFVTLPQSSAAAGAQSPVARSLPALALPSVRPSPSASPARTAPAARYRPATGAAQQVPAKVPAKARAPLASPVSTYPRSTQRPVTGQPWRPARTFRPGWPPMFLLPRRPVPATFSRASSFPLAPEFPHGA